MGVIGQSAEKAQDKATEAAAENKIIGAAQLRMVRSQLGFTLRYDPTVISATGQVTVPPKSTSSSAQVQEFADETLELDRPYGAVNFKSTLNEDKTSPTLNVMTNSRKDFWQDRSSNPASQGKSKEDILIDFVISPYLDGNTVMGGRENVTLGGVKYERVTLLHDNTAYGVKTPTIDTYFFTIQNDRPYWSVIANSASQPELVSTYMSILQTVRYSPIDETLLGQKGRSRVVLASDIELPKNTSNVPEELDEDSIVKVVLANQPSVVRILAIRCAQVSLVSGANKAEFGEGCNGGVGSGSFISSDGYIATNGHVVTVAAPSLIIPALKSSTENVQKMLDFLVAVNKMTAEQRDRLIAGVRANDASALSALNKVPDLIDENMLQLSKDKIEYGIQTSNQPIHIGDNGLNFSDTVVEARFVDMDYDEKNSNDALLGKSEFTHSDVAILKVKTKGEFPSVALGTIDSLDEGDDLTAIGFPAFVDNAIDTSKWQTTPTVTQGSVIVIQNDAKVGGRRIIRTDVQISAGNSGGPAFNNDGEQIGLVTYGAAGCPDRKCFGDGTVRDVADLKKLIAKDKISLKASNITRDWVTALESYESGDYKNALVYFDKVEESYPANYLVASLSRDARKQLGSDTDISGVVQTRNMVIGLFVAFVSIGLTAAVIIIVVILRLTKHHGYLPPQAPPPLPPATPRI
jgi:S1-C subfamily serine protease